MSFLRMFGIGAANALAGGQALGTVTEVSTCYWFKVNTKPIRRHSWDGAVYPHIIRFSYEVDGKTYSGKCWVPWTVRCPVKGEQITVFYEETDPQKYAVGM